MNQATQTLRHEHEAISLGLKILARMEQRVNAEQITDIEDLSTMTDFLKTFADTCHHGKEEGILFPALKEMYPAQTQGPIQGMLGEHTQGRQYLADMQAALQPTLKINAFHEAASAYAQLLRAHIEKENTILFPMAERLLSPEQQLQLAHAFDVHENKVMGPGQHEALHTTLKKLQAKYPA
jgi:hemerythrin-like domain-containing protein